MVGSETATSATRLQKAYAKRENRENKRPTISNEFIDNVLESRES